MVEVTIDELARMIQRGFLNQEKLFRAEIARLDKRIARLDKRIDGLDNKFDSEIYALRVEMKSGFQRINSELDEIRADVAYIKKRTLEDDNVLAGEVVKLEKRVVYLEKEVKRLKLAKA